MNRRMRIFSITIILIVIASFMSCKNDLKVSILDPLPSSVLLKYTEKDSLFSSTYNEIRFLADSIYKLKSSSLEYSELTYSRFYDLAKSLELETEKLKKDSSMIRDWNNKYKDDLVKFDHDSIYYKKYINDNDYSNFVDFELLKIHQKKSWILNSNYAEILIKPKNGHGIRKVDGYVIIIPKDEEEEDTDSFKAFKYTSALFSYQGYSKKNIKEDAFEFSNVSGKTLNPFIDIPVDIIKQEYNIVFSVHELIIDDKYIDVSLEKVPIEMKTFLKHKGNIFKTSYITENINKDYVSFNQFIYDLAKSHLMNDYKLELDFYNNAMKIYLDNLNEN